MTFLGYVNIKVKMQTLHTNLCISNKVFKNILFSQLARIKRICNNSESFMLATHNIADTENRNGYPLNLLTDIFNC